jgi:hypothetical protein
LVDGFLSGVCTLIFLPLLFFSVLNILPNLDFPRCTWSGLIDGISGGGGFIFILIQRVERWLNYRDGGTVQADAINIDRLHAHKKEGY